MDADSSGFICFDEMKQMFRNELCEPMDDATLRENVFSKLDTDGKGTVCFEAMLEWFVMEKLQGDAKHPLQNVLRQKLLAEKRIREVWVFGFRGWG